MAQDDEIRTGSEWYTMDVAFSGEVISETATGEIQAYGHDDDEVLQEDDLVKYEPYGFSSRTREGIEICLVPQESDELAVVGTFHPDRPSLTEGQVCIWDDQDNQILLKADDGGIHVEDKSGNAIDLKASAGGIDIDAGTEDIKLDGKDIISIASGLVKLGSAAPSDAVALASLVLTELGLIVTALNAFVGVYNGHVHVDTQPNSGTQSGGVSASGATAAPPTSVASTKVLSD